MPRTDMSARELRAYAPSLPEPIDLARFWATAGYAHLIMDTRGQGSGWSSGHTADPEGSGPAQPGFLTRGISEPATYYYRRVFVDAVQLSWLAGIL